MGVTSKTLEAYWTQLSVYADLLSRATGERVRQLVLVFARLEVAAVLQRASMPD